MKIELNQRVTKHQPGDYTHGRKGTVIEIDEVKQRARVQWAGVKTWVKFTSLIFEGSIPGNKPIAIPGHTADMPSAARNLPMDVPANFQLPTRPMPSTAGSPKTITVYPQPILIGTKRWVYVRGYQHEGIVLQKTGSEYLVHLDFGSKEMVPKHYFYHRDSNNQLTLLP